MFKKMTPEEKEENARPRWVISRDDSALMMITPLVALGAFVAPFWLTNTTMELIWPATMAANSLWGIVPALVGFASGAVFVKFMNGRSDRWFRAREIPGDEEIQDRLQTAMVSE